LNGFGTIAIYGLLVLLFTSDASFGTRHLFAYPLFILMLTHGLLLGTDTKLDAMKLMYATTLIVVMLLTLARGWQGNRHKRITHAKGNLPHVERAVQNETV